ncbi:MAG TPA: DUF72 domain-containing protein [Candidatus Polarisedimenticolaceae bacterium]|nr:DUF72 domain-containing protein [Candidatus Polarisedimenticolaceae bacterium]
MIRVGVAGWDYPDWVGPVYPERAPRRFDRLAYLSRFVDVLEINSTFYRPADPRTAESWLRRTDSRPGFTFTAKAHRSWTHEKEPDFAVAVPETLLGLAPLRDAGRLGALLVQFPQSFRRKPEALDKLRALQERLEGWPAVVEVRDISWDDEEVTHWLRQLGLGWCVVDQPAMPRHGERVTVPPTPRVTSDVAYLRLHGRNARDWFRKDAGRDARYDYLYRPDQMAKMADAVREMEPQAKDLFAVQNNHFRGKALANALMLRHLLGEEQPPAPEGLVRAYPELEGLVSVEQPGLF